MTDRPKLTVPSFRVLMLDGTEWTVTAAQPDLIAWDMTRGKHGWPDAGNAPSLWSAFVAYKAGQRTGNVPAGTNWQDWSATVSLVTVDGDEDETVDPTQTDPALG